MVALPSREPELLLLWPPSKSEMASCTRNDIVAYFPVTIRVHPIEITLLVEGVKILGSVWKREGFVNDGDRAATPNLTITIQNVAFDACGLCDQRLQNVPAENFRVLYRALWRSPLAVRSNKLAIFQKKSTKMSRTLCLLFCRTLMLVRKVHDPSGNCLVHHFNQDLMGNFSGPVES